MEKGLGLVDFIGESRRRGRSDMSKLYSKRARLEKI